MKFVHGLKSGKHHVIAVKDGVKTIVAEHTSEGAALDHISDLYVCYSIKNWATTDASSQIGIGPQLLQFRSYREVEGINGDTFYIDIETDQLICKSEHIGEQTEDEGLVNRYYIPVADAETELPIPPVSRHQRKWGNSARHILMLFGFDQLTLMEEIDKQMVDLADKTLASGVPMGDLLTLSISLTPHPKEVLQEFVRLGDMLDSGEPDQVLEAAQSELLRSRLDLTYPLLMNNLHSAKKLLDSAIHTEQDGEQFPHLDCVVLSGTILSTINLICDEATKQEQAS